MWRIIISFVICLILYPIYINFAKIKQFGQKVRGQGPPQHSVKEGVPTGGGLVFGIVTILSGTIFGLFSWDFLVLVGGFLLIGFLDDLAKFRRRKTIGLKAREKLILQTLFLLPFVWSLYQQSNLIYLTESIYLNLGYFYPIWAAVIILATSNAYNFTDGQDGLAAGVGLIILFFLWIGHFAGVFFFLEGHIELLLGALIAFLWYNSYPAKVIMGDSGSLFVGAYLSGLFLILRQEIFIPIFGVILVAELLSVVIQVIYFRLTGGKRVFLMAPIHHHYEMKGIPEVKITLWFWIITFISGILALFILMNLWSF